MLRNRLYPSKSRVLTLCDSLREAKIEKSKYGTLNIIIMKTDKLAYNADMDRLEWHWIECRE